EQDQESLGAHEKLLALLARKDDAERRYKDALARRDQVQRYGDRLAEIEGRVAREYGAYRNAPDDLPEVIRAYAGAQTELEKDQETLSHVKKELRELKPLPNAKGGLAIGIVAAVATVGILDITPLAGPAAIVLGIVMFPLGYLVGRALGT